ncbi:glucuronate isomerase [Armatimonas rosea]|uniref:Uronate isomerase n=1 Tax=Armatimonas rosea TaxID=685828 RepID=A0A7W9SRK0_ARMRO|nr:glucuronate isomerase [Armatimonas rosea]MBB6051130.1 glucuronate isomerase [Armatimonas rosea]
MNLHPDRCFSPEPARRGVARTLYAAVKDLPLVCPHGHVDPALFSNPDYRFGSPAELLLIPDHYVFRMLYSQGISLEAQGVPRRDGGPTESDHRKIWQVFCEHFYLFAGTPSGQWLTQELVEVFGLTEKPSPTNAQRLYDSIAARLETPEFRPRALFEQFKIEVLCTTDAASDPLTHHQAIRSSGWSGKILPTFRPDAVVNLDALGWRESITALEQASGVSVTTYAAFLEALRNRRAFFKSLGATATDHAAVTADTTPLSDSEASTLFDRALAGRSEPGDAARFTAHMLYTLAGMSADDGLTMQLHVGSHRNHNKTVFERFGADKGADIPVAGEFTRNLLPLLNAFGTDPRLSLILFTLDETLYSRELAPLAGHYPVLRLGPPWWFFDSRLGMRRFLEGVVETAGVWNLAGFNDDTRAFCSIPARHDVWRRVVADWLAGLVVEHVIDEADAAAMATALCYDLAKTAYRL